MIIRPNETKTLELKGVSIDGFTIKVFGKRASGSGAIAFNLRKINIKAILYRNGDKTTIFSDVLLPLVAESCFRDSRWKYARGLDSLSFLGGNLLLLGINFGSVINLKGTDKMEVELTMGNDAVSVAAGSVLGDSYVQLDESEGIGIEYQTPMIVSKAISQGESSLSLPLGDNVTAITFINTNDSSDYADSPINTLQLSSDRYTYSDTLSELVAKRSIMFEVADAADERQHSYTLYPQNHTELDKVSLDFQFNAENVETGKNFVVVRQFMTSPSLIERAVRTSEKHRTYMHNKINS